MRLGWGRDQRCELLAELLERVVVCLDHLLCLLLQGRDVCRGRVVHVVATDIQFGLKAVLSDDELLDEINLSDEARTDLNGHAPLWFYVLKEAELKADGHHLGPVGGRIVAEVLIGLLAGDLWVPRIRFGPANPQATKSADTTVAREPGR
jgi:hypothetical protein